MRPKMRAFCLTLALLLIAALSIHAQPRIVVDPLSIETDLNPVEIHEFVVNIANEGDELLTFNIQLEYLAGDEGWIEFDPDAGEIEPDEDMDAIVTLDFTGFNAGDYEADLHILNNDPENEDVAVNVSWHVIGAPDIEVEWSEEIGFPDLVDWNRAHDPLYTGAEYTVPVTIRNLGTDVLHVETVRCDDPFFRAGRRRFEVAVNDEFITGFWLQADENGVHEAEMVIFSNDPDEEEFSIPLRAETVDPPEHRIPLRAGWTMISSYLDPFDDDLPMIFHELVERDNLILVKDGWGHFYNPEFGFMPPNWNFRFGYLVKTRRADELVIRGWQIEPDTPIPLREGWNMIAYFPEEEVEAPVAFRSIEDVLIIVKDGDGRFYIPEFGFSNLEPLHRGKGYQVKVSEDAELIWNVQE